MIASFVAGGGDAVAIVMFALPLTFSTVPTMVAVPALSAETIPAVETLAIDASELAQLAVWPATTAPFASRASAEAWVRPPTVSRPAASVTTTAVTGCVEVPVPESVLHATSAIRAVQQIARRFINHRWKFRLLRMFDLGKEESAGRGSLITLFH